MQAKVAQSGPTTTRRPGDTLAYEHVVGIELGTDLFEGRMAEIRASCASRNEWACAVLDVSYQTQLGVPSGSIRLRMAPAAVDPVIALASRGGRITSRNTHAEDLAEPVQDTERELSLLSAHRDRLVEFTNRKGLPVEQMISVSKELASVQTQIDEINSRKANLRRRIDTELLTITLSPPPEAYDAEQTPIKDALSSFGTNFKEAIAQVIQFVAVLVPWLIVILPLLIALRFFWRWISRWIARREARSS